MIYLDSAATTLQKPPGVAGAVAAAMARAASPGRGGHRPGMEAAQIVFTCREQAARLFHVPQPEQVVLTGNATHGLNIAIHSLIRPGSTVLISGYEHNAVTRPLCAIPEIRVRTALSRPFDPEGLLESFRRELRLGVDAVVCTHVSNVFGFILPIREIAVLCRERNVPLIVDASQSAGCVPIDFTELGAQFIAMPGHKGLYGPQGTGLLLCGEEGRPLMQGGTGSLSASQTMPDFLPDRLEAGTPNVPGAAGLLEGLRFVSRQGVERIAAHERHLIRAMGEGLERIGGVSPYLAAQAEHQAGVLSFTVEGQDCEELGGRLADMGIAVRAGLHCAPLAHQTAGTLERGTVRVSVSCFNTLSEMRCTLRVLERLCRSK